MNTNAAAARSAEPSTLAAVKAADAAWFAANPERSTRLRLSYECEHGDTLKTRPDMVMATVVRQLPPEDELWCWGEIHGFLWCAHEHLTEGEPGEELAKKALSYYLGLQEEKEWLQGKFERYAERQSGKTRVLGAPITELPNWVEEGLYDRAAEFIDQGAFIDQGDTLVRCLEHLKKDPQRVMEEERELIVFQAFLDRDKRAQKRARLAAEKAAREREEQEKQEREKAALERKEKEKRDRLAREEREREARIASGKGTFADESIEPLPDGLKRLTFRLFAEEESDDDDGTFEGVTQALKRCFGTLGCVDVDYNDGHIVEVEILAAADLAAKYLLPADSPLTNNWNLDGARFEVMDFGHADRFATKRTSWQWCFRGIDAPYNDPDYRPGDFARWLEAAQAREEDSICLAGCWRCTTETSSPSQITWTASTRSRSR
jgi:hypothetical protein